MKHLSSSLSLMTLWAGTAGLTACDSPHVPEPVSPRDHEIVTSSAGFAKAILGKGYDEVSEKFRGDCATGEEIEIGAASSGVLFDHSMSKDELASSMGFELKARARYGLAKYSGAASFAASSQESDFSSSAVYSAQYSLPNLKLKNPKLQEQFEPLLDDEDAFVQSCGHEYVEQIVRGAKLFISVKVDLHNKKAKEEFDASFNVKGPAFNIGGKLHGAKEKFAGRATITIQAYQYGGDASLLSAVLSGTTALNEKVELNEEGAPAVGRSLHAVVSCGFEDVEACETMLETALYYATSVTDEQAFPQQIKDFPADIGYVTMPWATAAVNMPPAVIGKGLKAARDQLSSMFEEEEAVLQRVRDLRKMAGRLAADAKAQLPGLEQRALDNINLIVDAVPHCYDIIDVAECVGAVAEVSEKRQVTPSDELVFKIGPLPAGLYQHKEVLLRAFEDASFCTFESPEHLAVGWRKPPEKIGLPDWDTFHDVMSDKGRCRLDLAPGLYSAIKTVFEGEGDQLCNYISPTHFELGAAPRSWGDVVALPELADFLDLITLTGHCRVILPKGNYEYKGDFIWSDGVSSYCSTEPAPDRRVLIEEVPFQEFMTYTGVCGKQISVWVGIESVTEGHDNTIYGMDGSVDPSKFRTTWKDCPDDHVRIGAHLDPGRSFWVCTTPALMDETFYVARFVNKAAFVYLVQNGSIEEMGGIEYSNCPMRSSLIGALPVPKGFWACSGGGITPPPAAEPSGTLLFMRPFSPDSTAQQWFFDPIGASPSRTPADLAASKAGFMVVHRHSGMALDHSGSFNIGDAWVTALYNYIWGTKGQVWTLHKDPNLDLYLIRDEATGMMLDYAGAPDGTHPVIYHHVNGAPAQLWDIRPVDDGYYVIVNNHSGEAIDL